MKLPVCNGTSRNKQYIRAIAPIIHDTVLAITPLLANGAHTFQTDSAALTESPPLCHSCHHTYLSATGLPMLARLPQEIYDEFLGYLQDDRQCLQSCALVCRAWLTRARYHLFRSVALDPSPRSRQFVELARLSPDLPSYVRDLELRGRASTSKGWWEGDRPSEFPWPTLGTANASVRNGQWRRDSDVLETLSWLQDTFAPSKHADQTRISLPKVQELRLEVFTFNSDTTVFLGQVFPSVGTLSLNGCRATSFADLVQLLRSFPRLHTLRLASVEWLPHRPDYDVFDGRKHAPLKLTHLEVSRDMYVEPVVDWLLTASAHKTITSLTCSVSTQKSAAALRAFLHASGDRLERLSITLSEARDPTSILEATQFDLSPCTCLRTLHIQCTPPRSIPTHYSLTWVLILPSKLRSSLLSEIRLSIRSADLRSLNLEGLDVVLSKHCYKGLQRLTFDVDEHAARPGGR
ncbi:hypothetical protein C8Q76DRAFT_749168 [Earliella scabrosa]|nr:hypothetical protein C8Q76DRAFT_749168 [Earliella scabrosa]